MAAREQRVGAFIDMIRAGTPETGLWCDACHLPSRVRIRVFITHDGGSDLLATRDECQECGARPVPE